VVVPRECPLHLDQLHLLAVQLGHDLGLPLPLPPAQVIRRRTLSRKRGAGFQSFRQTRLQNELPTAR
jgi:hypothetical protein